MVFTLASLGSKFLLVAAAPTSGPFPTTRA